MTHPHSGMVEYGLIIQDRFSKLLILTLIILNYIRSNTRIQQIKKLNEDE